jgi:hypothetical protein
LLTWLGRFCFWKIFINKNIMNKLILEEIQRMDLLSRYDSSKTLNEQTAQITPEMNIAYDFYDRASKSAGTNPNLMRTSISQIKDANQFWMVNDLVKKNSGGMDIAAVINDELDSNNLFTVQSIFNHLKSKGITSTYTYNGKSFNKNTFKITTPPGKSDLTQTAAAGLPEWTKTFPCLSDRGTMKPSSNPKAVSFTNTGGEIYFFYDDKSFLYIYPDKVTQLKGTFDCVNGALLIKTSDGQQWTKAGWTKNPVAKTTQTQKTAAASVQSRIQNVQSQLGITGGTGKLDAATLQTMIDKLLAAAPAAPAAPAADNQQLTQLSQQINTLNQAQA